MEKGTWFNWTREYHEAFLKLKGCLTSAPISAYPTDNRIFSMDTDARQDGLAPVLSQAQEGVESDHILQPGH